MKTTMRHIAALLDPEQCELYLHYLEIDKIYSFADYTRDLDQPEQNICYIIDYSDMHLLAYENHPMNLLCHSMSSLDAPVTYPENMNLLFTTQVLSSQALYSLYSQEKPKGKLSDELLSVLPGCGMETLTEIASRHLMNPVIVCNSMFEVLSFDNYFQSGLSLKQFAQDNLLREDLITIIQEFFNYQNKSGTMISYMRKETEEFVLTVFPVINAGIIAYYVLIPEYFVSLNEMDLENLNLLKNVYTTQCLIELRSNTQSQMMHEYLLVRLINREINSKAMVYARLKLLDIQTRQNFFFIAIAPSQDQLMTNTKLNQLAGELRGFLRPGILTVFKNLIIALYSTDENDIPAYIRKELETRLKYQNMQAGISRRYCDIEKTNQYYRQALDALAGGRVLDPQNTLFDWENYVFYRLLSDERHYADLLDYVSDDVRAVIDYDREYNTDFTKTLYYYLLNVCNSTRTANALNLHRNTLVYRINKIQEITGADFSNGNTLMNMMLSFKALEVSAKMTDRTVCFFQ